MKMKRMIASVLALLLVVSLLPIGALAATVDNNQKGHTEPEIKSGDTMNNNKGTVTTNNGTLNENKGTVTTNNGNINSNLKDSEVVTNNKEITINYTGGTVKTNALNGTITENWGTVNANNGTVGAKNESGTIVPNSGNSGTIGTNSGTIITNNNGGTVGQKDDNGNAVAGTGNNGTIETNNGTVITNNEGGTVETNVEGGEIETNNGTVGEKDKDGNAVAGTGNSGTIKTNEGTVITNNEGGKIENNYGTVETNNGYVWQNYGTVETNNWVMLQNNGTVETNNNIVYQNTGTVETNDGGVYLNTGTVETNNNIVYQNTGTVETNKGSVYLNNGTVETNKAIVDQNTGTVETNAIDGYVRNVSDKEIAEYSLEDGEGNEAPTEKGVVNKNFGTVYDAVKNTFYYGLSWGENTDHLNLIDGAVKAETEKNLDEIASSVKRDGYRRTGYTAYYREGGKDIKIEETNRYIMNAPTWLKILWEKIVTAVGSNEPEAKKTSIPTSLSADQVKVGAYVRQGSLLFRIIEVGDDYIRVATVPKLSEQALADMLGFLKQHLSDAQIAKINGEPALLEQELVTYFFGGTFEHISFYAAPDLFA